MENKIKQKHLENEYKMIHLMLKNPFVTRELLEEGFSFDLFDPNNRLLIAAIYEQYSSSDTAKQLTYESYRYYLTNRNLQEGVIVSNLNLYDQCAIGVNANINDLNLLKRQVVEGYVARMTHESLSDFSENSKSRGWLYSVKILQEQLQKALSIAEIKKNVYTSVHELKADYIKYLKDLREDSKLTVRCGIDEIDGPINVGFKPMHLTLFVADVGGYKTSIMLNVALNLVDRGHKVLFIPLEMTRFDLLHRIVSNRIGIEMSTMSRAENLSEEDMSKIENAEIWESSMTRFNILEADEQTSVLSLKHEIENKTAKFHPDVVIIDYIDTLQSDSHYHQRYIEIGDILKSLRFLGKKHKFHIISAAQMGRAAIKALREGKTEAVDSTSIYGSHQYAADSDTIFALMKVKDEPDRIKIYTVKARHGPSGQTKELRVDPARCIISSTTHTSSLFEDTEFDSLEDDINIPKEKIESIEFVNTEFTSEDDELLDL